MRLPNAAGAQVDSTKITQYLLSADNPEGRPKAEFFTRFGFSLENWLVLRDGLRQHAASGLVTETEETIYGTASTE